MTDVRENSFGEKWRNCLETRLSGMGVDMNVDEFFDHRILVGKISEGLGGLREDQKLGSWTEVVAGVTQLVETKTGNVLNAHERRDLQKANKEWLSEFKNGLTGMDERQKYFWKKRALGVLKAVGAGTGIAALVFLLLSGVAIGVAMKGIKDGMR